MRIIDTVLSGIATSYVGRFTKWILQSQLVRFMIVGTLTSAPNHALFYLLNERLGMPYTVASITCSCISIAFAFGGHWHWTFRHVGLKESWPLMRKYFLLRAVAGLAVALVVLPFLSGQWGMRPLLAQIIAMTIAGVPVYFFTERIFKGKKRTLAPAEAAA